MSIPLLHTGKIAAQKLDDFFDKHMIVRYANSDDDDDYDNDLLFIH
jgi:hypothetical protein